MQGRFKGRTEKAEHAGRAMAPKRQTLRPHPCHLLSAGHSNKKGAVKK